LSVLKHRSTIREHYDSSVDGQLLLIVLEIIVNCLLLDQSSYGFDVIETIFFNLAFFHPSLIAYDESVI